MDAGLIINRNSRRSRRWGALMVDLLAEQGVSVVRQWHVRGPRLQEAGQLALESQVSAVLVGGGDGTLGALAQYFAHRDVTLGVLPLGTGNALAHDLGIPTDPREACQVIAEGHTRCIDLGRVGDRYFVNHVAAGASTIVSRSLSAGSKRWLGKLAYLSAAVQAFPRIRSFTIRVVVDDEEVETPCMQFVAGSGRHHAGPFLLSPDATNSSGRLLIYWLASHRRGRLLQLIRALPSGAHVEMADVVSREVDRVRIETSRPVSVSVDGEVGLRTPIVLSVERNALRVFVPRTSSV